MLHVVVGSLSIPKRAIGTFALLVSGKDAMKRLDQIHDNAERTAALSPGDMLLARLVLNGHLTGGKKP